MKFVCREIVGRFRFSLLALFFPFAYLSHSKYANHTAYFGTRHSYHEWICVKKARKSLEDYDKKVWIKHLHFLPGNLCSNESTRVLLKQVIISGKKLIQKPILVVSLPVTNLLCAIFTILLNLLDKISKLTNNGFTVRLLSPRYALAALCLFSCFVKSLLISCYSFIYSQI